MAPPSDPPAARVRRALRACVGGSLELVVRAIVRRAEMRVSRSGEDLGVVLDALVREEIEAVADARARRAAEALARFVAGRARGRQRRKRCDPNVPK